MEISKLRPIPDGYCLEWDDTIWNVGHVFRWSPVYEMFLQCRNITVKPKQTLAEAFEAAYNHPMWNDYEVFFVKDF